MRALLAVCLASTALFAASYDFWTFVEKVYKYDAQILDVAYERIVTAKEREAVRLPESLNLELSTKRGSEGGFGGKESSAMLTFSIRALSSVKKEEAVFGAKENLLEIAEKTKKAALASDIKKGYLLFTLLKEEEIVLSIQNSESKKALQKAKTLFAIGRLSAMELAKFEAAFEESGLELKSVAIEASGVQNALKNAALMDEDIALSNLSFKFCDVSRPKLLELAASSIYLKELDGVKTEFDKKIEANGFFSTERVNFGIGHTKEPTSSSVDFRAVIPLAPAFKNEKKLAALYAGRDGAIQKKQALAKRLELFSKTAADREELLRLKIQSAEAALNSKKKVFETAKKGYESGFVSLFEYLFAQNEYFAFERKIVAYKKEYIEEIASIEREFGGIIL